MNYAHSALDEHFDYYDYRNPKSVRVKTGDADYHCRNNYLAIGGVFRGYWFHKRRISMYSKVELGMMLRFKSIEYSESTKPSRSEHKTYVLPDINLSPVGLEFGGVHWGGFFEVAIGTTYICSMGVKYSF